MAKFFLVKGNHTILQFQEIAGKAHAITPQGTFKMRENPHSNTFIAERSALEISKIYELSALNYKEIYDSLKFSSVQEIKWTDIPLTVDELECFTKKYFLLRRNSSVAKIEYSEVIKILRYLQSLENYSEFSLFHSLDNGRLIKEWATNAFKDVGNELGFFILLLCLQNDTLDSFIPDWKRADLFDIDLKGFLTWVDSSFLEKIEKTKVKKTLSKLL